MKNSFTISARLRALLLGTTLGLAFLGGTPRLPAATYVENDLVSDFTLQARRSFTNDAGSVIPAGSPVRLSDFAGKIVFLEFFYAW